MRTIPTPNPDIPPTMILPQVLFSSGMFVLTVVTVFEYASGGRFRGNLMEGEVIQISLAGRFELVQLTYIHPNGCTFIFSSGEFPVIVKTR